jgi:hypothetical protein
MDESYVVEEYPHICGYRVHSLVEYLTSLENTCSLQLYLWFTPFSGEYVEIYAFLSVMTIILGPFRYPEGIDKAPARAT